MLDLSAKALREELRSDAAVTALRVGAAAEQRDRAALQQRGDRLERAPGRSARPGRR
jgi:hypothetical protein